MGLPSDLDGPNDPSGDAFACRRFALRLERLARDLIAGRPVTKKNTVVLETNDVSFVVPALPDMRVRI